MIISDEAREYLEVQKGAHAHLRGQRDKWEHAYREDLAGALENIKPWLPKVCDSILDVGGGMGGIDVLLGHHYDPIPEIAVLDGESDPPICTLHRKTFNDLGVTQRFLDRNGIKNFTPCPAHRLIPPRPFDLIVSFGSWCFHYEPDTYLKWVVSCCTPQTVLILEVRRDRLPWMKQLLGPFELLGCPHPDLKFNRMVFRLNAKTVEAGWG